MHENRGDAVNAIYDQIQDTREAVAARENSGIVPEVDDVPFSHDNDVQGKSVNLAAPRDNGRVGKAAPAFKTESTPEGEQTLIPGTEQNAREWISFDRLRESPEAKSCPTQK